MFIIEKLIDDHNRRVEAWERARDKWLEENEYYSRREYEDRYPRPGTIAKNIAKGMSIVLCVVLAFVLIIGFANEIIKDNKNKPKKQETVKTVNYKNGDQCSKYHIGDTGYINYGDYEGAYIKIVGGCGNEENYQVITLEDQTLFAEGSKHPQLDDVYIKAGLTLGVNDSRNITVTGHDKE